MVFVPSWDDTLRGLVHISRSRIYTPVRVDVLDMYVCICVCTCVRACIYIYTEEGEKFPRGFFCGLRKFVWPRVA